MCDADDDRLSGDAGRCTGWLIGCLAVVFALVCLSGRGLLLLHISRLFGSGVFRRTL